MDKRTLAKLTLIPGIALFLDQFTKYLVKKTFVLGESVNILGDTLCFTYIENQGIIFGIRVSFIPVITIISLIFTVALGYYMYSMRSRRLIHLFPFLLLFGGAVGNLIDRIISRGVVDFIDVNIPDISIPSINLLIFSTPHIELQRWPVFNVSDAFLTVGMILLIFFVYFDRNFLEKNVKPDTNNSQTI